MVRRTPDCFGEEGSRESGVILPALALNLNGMCNYTPMAAKIPADREDLLQPGTLSSHLQHLKLRPPVHLVLFLVTRNFFITLTFAFINRQ